MSLIPDVPSSTKHTSKQRENQDERRVIFTGMKCVVEMSLLVIIDKNKRNANCLLKTSIKIS